MELCVSLDRIAAGDKVSRLVSPLPLLYVYVEALGHCCLLSCPIWDRRSWFCFPVAKL